MHRRDFLKVSAATAAATCGVSLGLNTSVAKVDADPLLRGDPPAGWEHFEFMCGDGPDAKYRCKFCRGTFWVDACTEENLRLHRFPHKDYAELVPECEWCKLHEGYGVPVVPSSWGTQVSRFRKLHDDGGDDKYIFDWLDSAIEGCVYSRWGEPHEFEQWDYDIYRYRRLVYLPKKLKTVCAHPKGKYIERFHGNYAWGWGRMDLVRDMEIPHNPGRFEPFVTYSFMPNKKTQYVFFNRT